MSFAGFMYLYVTCVNEMILSIYLSYNIAVFGTVDVINSNTLSFNFIKESMISYGHMVPFEMAV